MELLARLPEEDKDLIHRYIAWYGGGDCETDYSVIKRDRMDYFLRYWASAKAPFYKMFGENFILKREISFAKNALPFCARFYSLFWWSRRSFESRPYSPLQRT